MRTFVNQTLKKYNNDKTRLMDILLDIQAKHGYISKEAIAILVNNLNMSNADIQQTISFYHFFLQEQKGRYLIFLNDSVVSNMMGREEVKKAFEEAAGCRFGTTTEDGLIGLYDTSCIGMSDQEPAALINGIPFTNLTPFRAKEIIEDIHAGKKVSDMISEGYGDGRNNSDSIKTMVCNHIRKKGPVLSDDYIQGKALSRVVNSSPDDIINEVKTSNIRGRGGAGFPTGLKWEFCKKAKDPVKYIFCNADEGEPGTFKDRVIMTEKPELVFEGMAIAGYSIGAREGILYLRYEYKYLQQYLEKVLQETRGKKFLGKNIAGKSGFNFDIRIQFGAGAYVCGEESALIESAEGKRGEPRDRPPFPVEKGYLNKPTVVNNVETLCSVVKIINNGPSWFKNLGTSESSGTKILSVSGDCRYPGIYEVEWGFSVYDILGMVGAADVQAVQIGGPSGTLIAPNEFRRILGYEDLSTGGSLIIFNKSRDLIKDVVLNFTEFFIEESCGSCSTCRVIPVLLRNKLHKIIDGHGVMQDIDELVEWGKIVRASRCGLGQTAANPVLTSLKNFKHLYEGKSQIGKAFDTGFDLLESVKESCEVTGRLPEV